MCPLLHKIIFMNIYEQSIFDHAESWKHIYILVFVLRKSQWKLNSFWRNFDL